MIPVHTFLENYENNDDDQRARMVHLLKSIRAHLPINKGGLYESLKAVEGEELTYTYKQICPFYGTGFMHPPIPEDRTYIIELDIAGNVTSFELTK